MFRLVTQGDVVAVNFTWNRNVVRRRHRTVLEKHRLPGERNRDPHERRLDVVWTAARKESAHWISAYVNVDLLVRKRHRALPIKNRHIDSQLMNELRFNLLDWP